LNTFTICSDGSYATINIPGSVNNFVEVISNIYGFTATPQAAASIATLPAVAAAPEPATCALLLLGFTGLGSAGYRNARNGRTALSA
jgi:hypothetical protein